MPDTSAPVPPPVRDDAPVPPPVRDDAPVPPPGRDNAPVPPPIGDNASDPPHNLRIGRVLARGTSWQTGPQVVAWVINIGMTPYVISGLGAGRYSIFLLINTLTMMLSTFDGGLGLSALRYYKLYAGRDDRASTTRLLVTVSAVLGAFFSVIFTALLLAAPFVLSFFKVNAQY